MIIGVTKELKNHEYRVGLTPDKVLSYIKHGHKVYVETNAGIGAGFSDQDYINAGAIILSKAKEVYDISDMIIKVKELEECEYDLLKEGQILYTYLHLASNPSFTEALLKKKIKAIAYETITDKNGALPCLRPMSQIAGRLSIQEGAKYLEKEYGGKGVLLSGVPGVSRGKVVIIGGGTAGEFAAKAAVGIGARVVLFDINADRLAYLDDIFKGSIETLYSTEANIKREILDADVVVGAVLIPGAQTPKLIRKEHLSLIKEGTVLVDIAIDQGGCFETSHVTKHSDPIYTLDGIVHYCVGNMPGAVPNTSTIALTNTTLKYGLMIADLGLEEALKKDKGLKNGLNIYDGKITYDKVALALNKEYYEYK